MDNVYTITFARLKQYVAEGRCLEWYKEVITNKLRFALIDNKQIVAIDETVYRDICKQFGYDNELIPPPYVSRGVGDTLAKITELTGIAKMVHVLIPNCGCGKRQDKLNSVFPY